MIYISQSAADWNALQANLKQFKMPDGIQLALDEVKAASEAMAHKYGTNKQAASLINVLSTLVSESTVEQIQAWCAAVDVLLGSRGKSPPILAIRNMLFYLVIEYSLAQSPEYSAIAKVATEFAQLLDRYPLLLFTALDSWLEQGLIIFPLTAQAHVVSRFCEFYRTSKQGGPAVNLLLLLDGYALLELIVGNDRFYPFDKVR